MEAGVLALVWHCKQRKLVHLYMKTFAFQARLIVPYSHGRVRCMFYKSGNGVSSVSNGMPLALDGAAGTTYDASCPSDSLFGGATG